MSIGHAQIIAQLGGGLLTGPWLLPAPAPVTLSDLGDWPKSAAAINKTLKRGKIRGIWGTAAKTLRKEIGGDIDGMTCFDMGRRYLQFSVPEIKEKLHVLGNDGKAYVRMGVARDLGSKLHRGWAGAEDPEVRKKIRILMGYDYDGVMEYMLRESNDAT